MRVSTSQIFDSGTLGIQRNQSGLYKLQNQLSSGRRMQTPADDPVAAAQALVVSQAKEMNAQYLDNQGAARAQLSLVEGKLGNLTDELQGIMERTIQAGNGSYDAAQRGMIATELKEKLGNVIALANSRDSEGVYLFSGFQGQSQPFQTTGNTGPYYLNDAAATPTSNPYMGYAGDDGLRKLQVSASQEMATNVTGNEVFMQVRDGQGGASGRSMFDSIQNLINILDPGSGIPFTDAAYKTAVGDMQAAMDNVSRVRSSVGARLASLDSLDSAGQEMALQYESRLSDLQDLDYAKAISDFSRQQVQLEAAQKSFAQVNQLSLFDYL